ncbi:uncharacterized protein LOC129614057 [Condylostylus longicornis]|uniref:uncharacterized protein LOC129614057 n=1 Tax=Condylostylus longicornis TaxID=2530218 RepID=UPI00244DC53C|nr:uncharacterized protein LOC129614057 [Condylostylus longicornis]
MILNPNFVLPNGNMNIAAVLLIINGSLFISYDQQFNRLNVDLICAASFFSGLIFGISVLTYVTHCGDVSQKYLRGSIASYIQCSIDFGVFLGMLILITNQNIFLTDKSFEIIGSLQIVFGVLAIFAAHFLVYESPIYLFEMGKESKAIENITLLKKELNEACYDVRTEIENIRLILGNKSSSMMKREDVKPILKIFFCRLAYSLSTSIFISAIFLAIFDFNQKFITLAMFFGKFIANIVPILKIDQVGRKIILVSSLIGSGIFLILTICSIFLFGTYVPKIEIYFVTVMAFIYNVFLGIGSSSAGYAYMSEVFEYSKKTYINALIIAMEYVAHLSINNISLERSTLVIGMIAFTAVMQLLVGGLSIVLMLETKGKTLMEAETILIIMGSQLVLGITSAQSYGTKLHYESQSLYFGGIVLGLLAEIKLLSILRKYVHYVMSSFFLIASGLLLCAYDYLDNEDLIKSSSFFSGLSFGVSLLTYIIHCGEISSKFLRGSIIGFLQCSIDAGLVHSVSHLATPFVIRGEDLKLNYDLLWIWIFNVADGIIAMILIFFLVYESPFYILENENEENALKILFKLRKEPYNTNPNVQNELDTIKYILKDKSNEHQYQLLDF